MTEAQFTSVLPRESATVAITSDARQFAFWRVHNSAETRFLPGDGTRLSFASKGVDTLKMPGLPAGFLVAGDKVKAMYRGVQVFLGEVDAIVRNQGRGDDQTETVTCAGPWSKMARLVYRQYWMTAVETNGVTSANFNYSSRLVLNMTKNGVAQDLDDALDEIADFGETPCGYQVGTVDVSSQLLPYDETRDITVADAIRRELRFFPKSVVRFDYSTTPPTLNIVRPSGSTDASYVSAIPKSARQYEYDPHPITMVDLEIESTGTIDDVPYRSIYHDIAPAGTQPSATCNPNCLYATLQVAGSDYSAVRQSFTAVTENIPDSLNDKTWWMSKHPRLANLAANAVTITEGARSGEATKSQYPRISAASAGELEEAGLRCRVEQFTCKVKIETTDYKEEEIFLSMNFLTTNAVNGHTYKWKSSTSSTSGETVPQGLAAAILADRSGALRAERMSVRLGDALPVLGDRCDGLSLQSFEIDCASLTADLNFGAPEWLSPEDMAALLSGFRNKCRSTASTARKSGKKEDEGDAEVEMGGIPPLSSTEFAPGQMAKQTFKAAAAQQRSGTPSPHILIDATGSGGKVEIKTEAVDDDKTIAVHTLTIVGAGSGGADLEFQILSDADITITPGGGGSSLSGTVNFIGNVMYDTSSHQLKQRVDSLDLATGTVTKGGGSSSNDGAHTMITGGQATSHASEHQR